jgi:hypothetical protein
MFCIITSARLGVLTLARWFIWPHTAPKLRSSRKRQWHPGSLTGARVHRHRTRFRQSPARSAPGDAGPTGTAVADTFDYSGMGGCDGQFPGPWRTTVRSGSE